MNPAYETGETFSPPSQAEIVGWLTHATHAAFQTMLGMKATVAEQFVEEPGEGLPVGVIGIIGLVGQWRGTAAISCSSTLACKIANTLFLTQFSTVNDLVLDAVAEMTNIIVGNVKNSLENRFGPMGLSIPAVIFGRNFATRRNGKENWYVIQFHVEGEPFDVQLCLCRSQIGRDSSYGIP